MEASKVQGEVKSVVVESGLELTYCERGEQNPDVLVCGAFYFHTFMPVVEMLAERYHVYGVVMRLDGPGEELNADGAVNWSRQWGRDVYEFARALGLERFRYFGKCHGTVPGWYLVKEHPEMLVAFASFFLAPHVLPQTSNKWFEMANGGDMSAMMAAALRRPEKGLPAKMAELATLGDAATGPLPEEYAASAEKSWGSADECREALLNLDIPVGYLFANEDPVFQDHYDSNIWAIMNTRRSRTVILNGEKHLMELDCPERVVAEAFKFFDEADVDYWVEDEAAPAAATAAEVELSGAPDPELSGRWACSFDGPMGKTEVSLAIGVGEDGAVSGTLGLMGKEHPISSGRATATGFDFEVSVKVAFRKGVARVRGTREGNAISGTIELPLGKLAFTGVRS